MLSENISIRVKHLTKIFRIYGNPNDRIKQKIFSSLPGLFPLFRQRRQYYSEFCALKDVSFDIKQGDVVGIIGKNGSGKSTLLQIICGTLSQTSGSLSAHGRISALLELGSGFNPEFTGLENIYMNGALLGLSKVDIDERLDEIVDFADIGPFINQPVKTYSSGMLVRVAFSVAINTDPQILIIDEALSVGDELFQRKCFSKIEDIRKRGVTILLVSHSASAIIELCNSAILIDSGECLAIGDPKYVVTNYQKLLYAPEESRRKIREAILEEKNSHRKAINNKLIDQCKTAKISHAALNSGPKMQSSSMHTDDLFDPNLQPTSTITYESRGPIISNVSIENCAGGAVNNLTQGKEYCISYRVKFDQDFNNIRFGTVLKTMTGIELGGAASHPRLEMNTNQYKAGAEYIIRFKFLCLLNHGVYFVNAGVLGGGNQGEIFLHRIVDAAMFRVRAQQIDSLSSGFVDFGFTSSISRAS